MATCESACCRPNLISSHVPSRPSSQQMYRRKDIYLSVTCQLYDSNDVMLSRRQRMNGSTSWNRKSFSSRPQVRLQLRFHKKVVTRLFSSFAHVSLNAGERRSCLLLEAQIMTLCSFLFALCWKTCLDVPVVCERSVTRWPSRRLGSLKLRKLLLG